MSERVKVVQFHRILNKVKEKFVFDVDMLKRFLAFKEEYDQCYLGNLFNFNKDDLDLLLLLCESPILSGKLDKIYETTYKMKELKAYIVMSDLAKQMDNEHLKDQRYDALWRKIKKKIYPDMMQIDTELEIKNKNLEKEIKEMQLAIKSNTEICTHEKDILQLAINGLKEGLQNNKEEIQRLKTEKQGLIEENQQLISENNKFKGLLESHGSNDKQLVIENDALRKQNQTLQQQITDLEKNNEALREEGQELVGKIFKIRQDRILQFKIPINSDGLQGDNKEQEPNVTGRELNLQVLNEIDDALEKAHKSSKQMDDALKKTNAIVEENVAYKSKNETLNTQNQQLQQQIAELSKKGTELQQERNNCNNAKIILQKELGDCNKSKGITSDSYRKRLKKLEIGVDEDTSTITHVTKYTPRKQQEPSEQGNTNRQNNNPSFSYDRNTKIFVPLNSSDKKVAFTNPTTVNSIPKSDPIQNLPTMNTLVEVAPPAQSVPSTNPQANNPTSNSISNSSYTK